MEESVLVLTASADTSVQISIQGVPTADGTIVSYETLPGNSPKTNGNQIYVWQTTGNIVPWNKDPVGNVAVTSDSSTSTQSVPFDFEQKGYIIGYAVAATTMAVVATIYMPAGKQEDPESWKYANIGLKIVYVGTNLVQVKYTGLDLYKPATNKNWLGLWRGGQVPWSGDPIAKVNITQDAPPSGYKTIEGVPLLIGTSYSVGYFMVEPTKGRTSLAASATFTVGAGES